MAKSPFDEAKPRTPKAAARQRAKEMEKNATELLTADYEETFAFLLEEKFNVKRGSPQYEAALAAWREGRS